PKTGTILWQTADPQVETLPGATTPVGVWDLAPVTVANGVLYAASMAKLASQTQMFALDAPPARSCGRTRLAVRSTPRRRSCTAAFTGARATRGPVSKAAATT